MVGSLGTLANALDEQAREAGVDVKTDVEIREPLSSSSTETGGIRQPSCANGDEE